MIKLKRILNLEYLLSKKSFFLFGPRASGKTFLIKNTLPSENFLYLNLLHHEVYAMLLHHPEKIREIVAKNPNCHYIVIDEIQRVPELLNEVHALIEEQQLKFLLTGSNARNLRKSGINLLAGRAWEAHLYPLVFNELPDQNLERYLQVGGLPSVYLSEYPEEELHSYIHTYLQQEIQAESFIRKLVSFSKFLEMAALSSGNIINFSSLASDSGIPASTIREYYRILEDTFLGFIVPAWTKSVKRKPIAKAKFYFFDLGVKNTLAGIKSLNFKSDLFGQNFEHFIALELRAYLGYRRIRKTLAYWQTTHNKEVDFIIDDEIAIEVKTTETIQAKHLKNLQLLQEENICKRYICVSFDKITRKQGSIELYYWQDFLHELWSDQLLISPKR